MNIRSNWNFKPKKSNIFHFDLVIVVWMAPIFCVIGVHVQHVLTNILTNVRFMSFGQSIECQNWCWMSNIIFFNCSWVLQFGVHSRYYMGALTQERSFLVICTTFRSDFYVGWKNQNKRSTPNSSFDALSKWHEPDIKKEPGTLHSNIEKNNNNQTMTLVHSSKYLPLPMIYDGWI